MELGFSYRVISQSMSATAARNASLGWATGGKANEQAHRSRRIGLRPCISRRGQQRPQRDAGICGREILASHRSAVSIDRQDLRVRNVMEYPAAFSVISPL